MEASQGNFFALQFGVQFSAERFYQILGIVLKDMDILEKI